MMRDASGHALFVYYRVRASDRAALVAAARAMQARWHARVPGLQARLHERADAARPQDGTITLMETYAAPKGIAAALQATIEDEARAELGRWIVGDRHVEVFVPCA
jgi:hypothetical protein